MHHLPPFNLTATYKSIKVLNHYMEDQLRGQVYLILLVSFKEKLIDHFQPWYKIISQYVSCFLNNNHNVIEFYIKIGNYFVQPETNVLNLIKLNSQRHDVWVCDVTLGNNIKWSQNKTAIGGIRRTNVCFAVKALQKINRKCGLPMAIKRSKKKITLVDKIGWR